MKEFEGKLGGLQISSFVKKKDSASFLTVNREQEREVQGNEEKIEPKRDSSVQQEAEDSHI